MDVKDTKLVRTQVGKTSYWTRRVTEDEDAYLEPLPMKYLNFKASASLRNAKITTSSRKDSTQALPDTAYESSQQGSV